MSTWQGVGLVLTYAACLGTPIMLGVYRMMRESRHD